MAQALTRPHLLAFVDEAKGSLQISGAESARLVPPQLGRKALVHGHCHHKSILKMSGEQRLLDKLGLDYEILDSGCCGMAGSFGFEKDKHAISIACGERVLLPAVRQAAEGTLIIADGFSCREADRSM